MSKKLSFKNLADYRKARNENQSVFWKRFGVTQSGGSRYEAGRNVPAPIQLLLVMLDQEVVTDEVLDKMRKAAVKART